MAATTEAPPPQRPDAGDDVAPVVAPPPGHPRFPLFDGLRAIAALGVLVAHAASIAASPNPPDGVSGAVLANGITGLTVFFVISGFLLYRPYASARVNSAPRPRAADYARRRALRIIPAYWIALTVLAIWPGLPGVFTGDWWKYYFFLSGYSTETYVGGLLVAWSLSVEICFYIVLPFYASALDRLVRGRDRASALKIELGILAAMSLVSAALRWIDYAGGRHIGFQQSLPVFWLWFAVGMALALVSAHMQHDPAAFARLRRVRPGASWFAALAVYAVLCVLAGGDEHYSLFEWMAGYYGLGALVALALVLPAVLDDGERRTGPQRLLAWAPVAWLGLVSYGIYLWHVQILERLHAWGIESSIPLIVAGTAVTACVAAASYYLAERPLLRFKDPRNLKRRMGRSTP